MGSGRVVPEVSRRLVLAAMVILATAGSASADPEAEADAHVARATELHGNGKFEEALDALKTAYALAPRPELLFAIGQVHVKLGRCGEAITFYERFLTTRPKSGPAAAAREAIEVCTNRPPAASPPGDVEPPAVEPATGPAVEPTPPVIEPSREPARAPRWTERPWYTDTLGDVLVGAGVLSGAAAIVLYRSAVADADDASSAETYQAHLDLVDRARTKRAVSIALGAAGGVLVGVGIIRYVIGDRRVEAEAPITFVPSSDGGVLAVQGRF
jgi:tetratricopeptide (TPR) repeat protein